MVEQCIRSGLFSETKVAMFSFLSGNTKVCADFDPKHMPSYSIPWIRLFGPHIRAEITFVKRVSDRLEKKRPTSAKPERNQ